MTAITPNNKTRRVLLFAGLFLLFTGAIAGGFAANPAKALSASELVRQVPGKYCAPLGGTATTPAGPYYTACTGIYNGAVEDVATYSTKHVNSKEQATCSSIINWPASPPLSNCGAYVKGVTDARKIVGTGNGSSGSGQGGSQQNNQGQNNNQPNNNNANQPPPISDCNKAKGASDQKKCKQEYRDCNNLSGPRIGPAVAACKEKVINKYKNNGGNPNPNPSPNPKPKPKPSGGQTACNSNSCDLVATYVNPFINLLSIVVGLVVAASLIMGGIQYSASSGDPQKTSAAKSRITNTILALLAYVFLYAFLNFLVPGGIFP